MFARTTKVGMSTPIRNDVLHHTRKLKGMMRELIEHLRADIGKVDEPQARAMFETSAEALTGLVKAFDDYENKHEEAWQG